MCDVRFEFLLILLMVNVLFVHEQLVVEILRNQRGGVHRVVLFLTHAVHEEPEHRLEKGEVLDGQSKQVEIQALVLFEDPVVSDHHGENLGHEPLLLSKLKVVLYEWVLNHVLRLQSSRWHQAMKMNFN